VVAVALAEALIFVDQQLGDSDLGALGFLIKMVGESGSRDLLGAIAGSMLTVASTTFSITIAVLALSSSTYGPRLVRNFMADRGNQFVLGIFVATFLYSLMVLRSIRVIGTDQGDYFVPHLAVNVAVLLAVLSIGVLVYFIHHISDSVQVWTLAEQVRTDLIDVVNRLYPEGSGQDARDVEGGDAEPHVPERLDTDGVLLTSLDTGYVQDVDLDSLLSLAHDDDLLVSLKVRPGKHVTEGAVLAVLWPPGELDDNLRGSARQAVRIGQARTPLEDVEFAALLLEEMAVRALSPSTNDPYTAINALDSLTSGLVLLAGRRMPSPYRYDDEGRLRVIAPAVSFIHVLDHLLDAMRSYAVEHPTVLHRTLELVAQVGAVCQDQASRVRMDTHVGRLVEAFSATSPQSSDLEALAEHAIRVRGVLLGSP
jgi:uncharacterized membrane protein